MRATSNDALLSLIPVLGGMDSLRPTMVSQSQVGIRVRECQRTGSLLVHRRVRHRFGSRSPHVRET